MKLSNAEADLLLNVGETEWTGTDEELRDHIVNTYWVLDDAPYSWRVREAQMKILSGLAANLGFIINTID